MNKFKEALIKFAHSNPSLFKNHDSNSYPKLIEQRFPHFFPDFQTPNHPPYAAMIHKAIWELNEKGGSSEESISKYIKQEYVDLPWAHSTLLKHHLEKLCDREEICKTRKQCYSLAGTDLDPFSSSISEKQLKRKHNSESGKKSSRKYKKRKSRQDSESGKTQGRQRKKFKKKKEHQLDLQENNKQMVEAFQEQDQVLQLLDEVADEQEKVLCNGLQEPLSLNIEDERNKQGDGLVDIYIQEVEEGVIHAIAAGQNQSDIGNDGVGEKAYMITQFDDDDDENQYVEQPNVKKQIKTCGTKKGQLKKKQRLKSKTSSMRVIKHDINEETELQVMTEDNLMQHNKITDSESHEQNQIIEVTTSDTQIPGQKEVGRSVNVGSVKRLGRRKNVVVGEVNEDGESVQESHPDKDGYTSLDQIQKENLQLLQLEPDSNPVPLKSKHPGKQVWTRSQLKMKKDATASSERMESPGCENMPKDTRVVEYLFEEKQQEMQIIGGKDAKQAPSAVSNQMNGQRAKLRSSKKSTSHLEIVESLDMPLLQMEQQKSRSSSLDGPLKELENPKSRPQFPDLDEPTAEVQERDNSQQDQQPDESEDQHKYQGSGRHLQTKKIQAADISLHSHADEDKPKYKGRGRHPKPREPQKDEVSSDSRSAAIPEKYKVRSRQAKQVQDKVSHNSKSRGISSQSKQSRVKDQGQCRRHKPGNVKEEAFLSKSADNKKRGQQLNEDDQPKYKLPSMHKMTRRSSSKKNNQSH